jgi:thymidylate synthase (FAD)
MGVRLVWATPNGEALIAEMARVSNPDNKNNTATAPKLIKYLIDNKHWSPFEMVDACVCIETTRDIGRQILRHRSFSFQEFSGRYQSFAKLNAPELRECRMQDSTNRQLQRPAGLIAVGRTS